MFDYGWWPHLERLLILIAVILNGVTLYLHHYIRDRSLEMRFITREDFRRIEAKLDTVMSIATYISAEKNVLPTKAASKIKTKP